MNRETIIKKMRDIDLIDFRDEDEDEHVAELVNKVESIVTMAVAKEIESRKAAQLENADLKERLARSGIEQRRAVAAEREECGWQPIETAPKDGTQILAYIHIDDGDIGVMKWMDFGQGLALWVWSDELMGEVDPDPYQPTHWMPLPPPPSAIRARREAT